MRRTSEGCGCCGSGVPQFGTGIESARENRCISRGGGYHPNDTVICVRNIDNSRRVDAQPVQPSQTFAGGRCARGYDARRSTVSSDGIDHRLRRHCDGVSGCDDVAREKAGSHRECFDRHGSGNADGTVISGSSGRGSTSVQRDIDRRTRSWTADRHRLRKCVGARLRVEHGQGSWRSWRERGNRDLAHAAHSTFRDEHVPGYVEGDRVGGA